MSTRQLVIVLCLYLAILIAIAYFTRAKLPRVIGALAGGATVGFVGLGMIAFGNALKLWSAPISWTTPFLVLIYLSFAISCAPFYLITWRLARRFGWRGITACIGIAAIIGPPRDYFVASIYPEWITFSPGVEPLLVVAIFYSGVVALGHGIMRLMAGPADIDQLARVRQVDVAKA